LYLLIPAKDPKTKQNINNRFKNNKIKTTIQPVMGSSRENLKNLITLIGLFFQSLDGFPEKRRALYGERNRLFFLQENAPLY